MGILTILVWCACAWGCYTIAEKNNRNTTLAAILGFFFGLFAILGYLIAGEKD